MITLTKDNHLTFEGTGSTWTCNIKPFPKTYDNLFVEAQKAAEEIYSLRQGNVYMMYSGGVDSEFALSIFLSLGMNVIPVIIKLNPGYNDHDIAYAYEFCKSKNITPITIDIDFDQFVKSGSMLEYAKKYKSKQYQMSATIHSISKLDGTILGGHCEPYINHIPGTDIWNFHYDEYEYSIANYYFENNIYGTPNFNSWTPGMMVSYLNDPRIIDLANNKIPVKMGSNSSKHIIYNRHGNLNLTVRPKLHGYEIVEKSEIFKHESFNEIIEFGKTCSGVFKKDYFEFMKEMTVL